MRSEAAIEMAGTNCVQIVYEDVTLPIISDEDEVPQKMMDLVIELVSAFNNRPEEYTEA